MHLTSHFLRVQFALRALGLLAAAFVLICTQGCSVVQTTYNHGEDITQWWIDGYVDLDATQRTQLQQDLKAVHQIHRKTQLPKYARTLQTLIERIHSDIDPQDICSLEPEIKTWVNDFLVLFEPTFTSLALTLSTEQLAHLQRKYDKNNSEWHKDRLEGSEEERLRFRFKKDLDIAERLYGKITQDQKTFLKALVKESPSEPERAYRERLRRETDLLQTLKFLIDERPSSNEAAQSVHALMMRSSLESPDAQYAEYLNKSLRAQCERAVKFHNITSAKQRVYAYKTLQDFEKDLTILINQP